MSTRALITILFVLSCMVSLSYGGMSCSVPETECSDILTFLCCHNSTGFEYCCTPWQFGSVYIKKQYPFLMTAGIIISVLILLCFTCTCFCRCVVG